jgi:hypothetical protein
MVESDRMSRLSLVFFVFVFWRRLHIGSLGCNHDAMVTTQMKYVKIWQSFINGVLERIGSYSYKQLQ